MGDLAEKTIRSEVVFKGNLLTLTKDTVRLPDGNLGTREVVHHPGASAVVAIDDAGQFILVRQFRQAVAETLWELPAGKLDGAEDPLVCAKRELLEETGYQARGWQKLTAIHTTPGFSNELINIYCATELTLDSANKGGDPDEFIEVAKFTQEELQLMVTNGQITDAKSLAGLLAHWIGRLS